MGFYYVLPHEDIKRRPERTRLLQHYEDKCNWQELEFSLKWKLAIQKVNKFERNNSNIAVNMLFTNKESIYTASRLELNGKCGNQVNLLMIVIGEIRYYAAIKNTLRIL